LRLNLVKSVLILVLKGTACSLRPKTNIDAFEWIRQSNPVESPNLICVYMGPKYETPSNGNSSSLPKKRGRSGNTTARVMVPAPQKTETLAQVIPEPSAPIPPSGDGISPPRSVYSSLIHSTADIKQNALYDPRLLSDYGGTVFDHTHAKLVQRHITDCTGALIPPWAEYDNLRTGTVVLIRVSLKIYCIQNGSKTRKVSPLFLPLFSAGSFHATAVSNIRRQNINGLAFRGTCRHSCD
jgi:hypothetical protein